MTDRIPVAVLGAGGYIGQHFVRLLADHPLFEVRAMTGGSRSSRQRFGELWQLSEDPPAGFSERKLTNQGPRALAAAGVRVAFSALPSGTARATESELIRRGVHVFSNASDFRQDPGVPLLVPEVNPGHLGLARPGKPLHVTNPNCTATGLVLALAPLWEPLRPRAVHVATYQALSGAGLPGVPSLHAMDNVVPWIDGEEEKVERESRHILGPVRGGRVHPVTVPFSMHCVRVPVRDGHLEAVTVDARSRPARSELLSAWRRFDPLRALELPTAPHPPLQIRSEPDRPQPFRDRWAGSPPRARGMAGVIGRVRWDPPYLRFFVLSHNAVRGGAGGSVLNAELAAARGLLSPVRREAR
jgi:aspartate-semialdehyde dehydrogenase